MPDHLRQQQTEELFSAIFFTIAAAAVFCGNLVSIKSKVNEIQTTGSIEGSALEIIRSETALSRFPMHRIAKKGEISIEFKDVNSALYWNVSHNSRYGQPGPLAYKIDTLLINRRIERAGKPVPKIIKLGSLPEMGSAHETDYKAR